MDQNLGAVPIGTGRIAEGDIGKLWAARKEGRCTGLSIGDSQKAARKHVSEVNFELGDSWGSKRTSGVRPRLKTASIVRYSERAEGGGSVDVIGIALGESLLTILRQQSVG